MIRAVTAGGLTFSQAAPKICAPVSGTSMEEVLWELRSLEEQPVDLVEWRADAFREDIRSALPQVREAAGKRPLLFTLRTRGEGGCREIPEYRELLMEVVRRGEAPMVDVELSAGAEFVRELTALARERRVVTVVSAHFFGGTPSKEVLAELLNQMEAVGGDIPKIAVMPADFGDTLALMEAAYRVSRENAPLIAIAMGPFGAVSRLCPGQIGSCLSFAAGKLASAPGQLPPDLVRAVLDQVK